MDKYSKRILNKLLDKYEASKSFAGQNIVTQNFYLYIASEFPKYKDDSDFDTFFDINVALSELKRRRWIQFEEGRNDIVKRISLNLQYLQAIYDALQRISKEDDNLWLKLILEEYANSTSILSEYANNQIDKIFTNKKVEFYCGNHQNYQDVLKICEIIASNKTEIYIRDLSIKIFGDSKRLEQIQGRVESLLYQCGTYEEKKSVFEECGVVKTPTYVTMKGNGSLLFPKQQIELAKLDGDLAISSKTIENLREIQIGGTRVITIENLTTFHNYVNTDDFCIYLGGFHNKIKEQFIKKLHYQNPDKEYYHFGDIDAGGFYIYEHLVRKTMVPFRQMHMNIKVLENNKGAWKALTSNDKKRLVKLLSNLEEKIKLGNSLENYRDVLDYMLEHNCKLEQEAVELNNVSYCTQ